MADRPPPAAAVAALACPVCRSPVAMVASGLRCPTGHAFDRARQGYVHLAAGAIRHPGDTSTMVEARERVQSAGLFDPLTAALVAAIPEGARLILDLGAGTGHHLAAVLRARETPSGGGPVGIAVDTSKPALRRAARAHPQVLAVAADATAALPVRDAAVDAAMVTFAPRAAEELARVLAPGGTLVVAVPTPEHLVPLREVLGMLTVPTGKGEQLAAVLGPAFTPVGRTTVAYDVAVDRPTAADLALMGPVGFHADAGTLRDRADALAPQTTVRIAVEVRTFRR